jgi:Na+:H+ antiporter, NhaA family
MTHARPINLDRPVDIRRHHVLGGSDAELTLVEYGSYSCPYCHAAHEVIADLRDRFSDRLRYVFRHRPLAGSDDAQTAAELAEYASETTGQFWPVHDALMKRGLTFTPDDFEQIASEFNLPPRDGAGAPAYQAAELRVQKDLQSAQRSGALITPTFFINDRRYEGARDESTLADAMLGSLGHRIQAAALDFVRWGPSAGLLLLLMSVLAVVLVNSPIGPAFEAWWSASFGFELAGRAFTLPFLDWVNHGLLTIFFWSWGWRSSVNSPSVTLRPCVQPRCQS